MKVERDPETGKILRVIHAHKRANPLNDPLNSDSENEEMGEEGEEFQGFGGEREPKEKNEIVRQLEAQASMEAEKTPRKQSEREREWIERLAAKHGDDFERMARDMRLNPMQQTAADIRKRVGKWRASGGSVSVEG